MHYPQDPPSRTALAAALLLGIAVASVTACGGGGGDNNSTQTACAKTIAAKESLGAGVSSDDAAEMAAPPGNQLAINMSGKYRDNLAQHPGCSPRATFDGSSEPLSPDNEATNVPPAYAAAFSDYSCSVASWSQPNDDSKKPIVILAHGNQSGVPAFLEYYKESVNGTTAVTSSGTVFTTDPKNADKVGREMLVTKLLAAGYVVYSWDARSDRIELTPGNAGNVGRMDHGWSVPLLQALIKAVINEYPDRKVSLIGHSLGATGMRDALRRLYVEYRAGAAGSVNPFASIKDAIWLSGLHHGVAGGAARCAGLTGDPPMSATAGCELGDRDNYAPTYFQAPLNGPDDVFATPCADASYAFGDHDACGGNTVQYTTITMEDPSEGPLHDELSSQASSALAMDGCVDNALITLADYDTSGYFLLGSNGVNANHLGSSRSNAAMDLIMSKLAD